MILSKGNEIQIKIKKRKDGKIQMDEKLQKIDEVVRRTNASYATAKKALEEADGDVLEAVILIETKYNTFKNSDAKSKGEEVLDEIKKILEKGSATKLTIKKNNEIILNLPITAGAVGLVISPFLALTGITAALLTQCTVEIQQADGQIIDVNEAVGKGMENMKSTMENVKNSMAESAENMKETFTESAKDMKETFTEGTEDIKDTFEKI